MKKLNNKNRNQKPNLEIKKYFRLGFSFQKGGKMPVINPNYVLPPEVINAILEYYEEQEEE